MLVLTVLLIKREVVQLTGCLLIRATMEESGLGIEEERGVDEASELVCLTNVEVSTISLVLASENEYNNNR